MTVSQFSLTPLGLAYGFLWEENASDQFHLHRKKKLSPKLPGVCQALRLRHGPDDHSYSVSANFWICAWSCTRGCLPPKVWAYELSIAPSSPSVWEARLCLLWLSAIWRSGELGDLRLQWRRSYEIVWAKNGPDVAWRFTCQSRCFSCVQKRGEKPEMSCSIRHCDLYQCPAEERPWVFYTCALPWTTSKHWVLLFQGTLFHLVFVIVYFSKM